MLKRNDLLLAKGILFIFNNIKKMRIYCYSLLLNILLLTKKINCRFVCTNNDEPVKLSDIEVELNQPQSRHRLLIIICQ